MMHTDKIHEECGVFGVYSPERTDVASLAYYALFALQHRGQESCGIVVNDDGVFTSHKDKGLVSEVFTAERIKKLGEGNIGVGHVLYGTAAGRDRSNAQPIVVNHRKGRMAIGHNGSLVNGQELREELELGGAIFHSTSDAEIIAYLIVQERLRTGSIEEAAANAMERLEGAYSIVLTSPTKLIGIRDPHGFRPLCLGKTRHGAYVLASETSGLDASGAEYIRDIEPGEIVVIDKNGINSITRHCNKCESSLCVFEFIYFSRPDSMVDGSSVHVARQRAGAFLALEHPVQADIVIGAPDSGLDAALGFARQSGIPYDIGLLKNKYIGRTFISPTQAMREDQVRIKLNAIRPVLEGKRVVLVDDSIVRGTTSRRTVKMIRDAGAKEVHMRISSPPFVNPCFYGTDIDSKENLIANNHTIDEIAKIIGADSLGFLSIENVTKLAVDCKRKFCTACFGGAYPTREPSANNDRYATKISEKEGNK